MVLLLVTGKPVWGFDRLMSPRKVADWLHGPICNKNACGCEKDTQTKLIYATIYPLLLTCTLFGLLILIVFFVH